MQLLKFIISVTLSLLVYSTVYGFDVMTSWKTSKKSEGVEISYRFIKVGDTLETRQMRMSFEMDATPGEIVRMFKNTDDFSNWSAGIKKCEQIENWDSSWITYSMYNIPWPFKQKDIITQYRLKKTDSSVVLYMKGEPDRLPYYDGISRIKDYVGYWVFKPLANGKTQVDFFTISFTKPVLPRFIQDPIIQHILIDSVQSLRELITQEKEA
jgi:hypothetical protein